MDCLAPPNTPKDFFKNALNRLQQLKDSTGKGLFSLSQCQELMKNAPLIDLVINAVNELEYLKLEIDQMIATMIVEAPESTYALTNALKQAARYNIELISITNFKELFFMRKQIFPITESFKTINTKAPALMTQKNFKNIVQMGALSTKYAHHLIKAELERENRPILLSQSTPSSPKSTVKCHSLR